MGSSSSNRRSIRTIVRKVYQGYDTNQVLSNKCLIYRRVAPTVTAMSQNVVSLPDTPENSDGLTLRQRKILEFITATTADRGYPPTVREIADAVGLSSSSSVAHQLSQLVTKGFINRDATRARALDVRVPEATTDLAAASLPDAAFVPLVGQIAAGGPILAEQAVEDVFPLPKSLVGDGTL